MIKKAVKEIRYIIEVNFKGQDKYVVRFPDYFGPIGYGEDFLEALLMAQEALEVFFDNYVIIDTSDWTGCVIEPEKKNIDATTTPGDVEVVVKKFPHINVSDIFKKEK